MTETKNKYSQELEKAAGELVGSYKNAVGSYFLRIFDSFAARLKEDLSVQKSTYVKTALLTKADALAAVELTYGVSEAFPSKVQLAVSYNPDHSLDIYAQRSAAEPAHIGHFSPHERYFDASNVDWAYDRLHEYVFRDHKRMVDMANVDFATAIQLSAG